MGSTFVFHKTWLESFLNYSWGQNSLNLGNNCFTDFWSHWRQEAQYQAMTKVMVSVCVVQYREVSVMWYGAEHTVTIVLTVSLYICESEPDESRFNHNCEIEALALPCDIKVKVLPDGSYSVAFIQISWTYKHDISQSQETTLGLII